MDVNCEICRHLHTIDTARRRGFGKILIQSWCKELLKVENIDPTAYVVAENHAAIKLFETLGFRIFRGAWFLKLDTADRLSADVPS